MKLIFVFYLVLIHAFALVAIIKIDILSRIQAKLGYEIVQDELTSHFFMMLAFHKRVDKNIPNNSVLFIGDSLIQGLAVSAIFPRSVNFGIGQDTTYGVLTRLPHYSSIYRSKFIVVAIGVNDLRRRENSEIMENFQKIIKAIPENIPVLFSGILPLDETKRNRPGYNTRIKKINKKLKEICEHNHRLHFLDISESLIDSKGNLSVDYHIGDGVHLNNLGNDIWISKLRAALTNIISQYKGPNKNGD